NVVAEIDHVKPDGVDVTGNIVLDVSGGAGPYTYEWRPGSFTAKDYTNIAVGTYTVKVKDSTPDSVYYYYNMGYKTHWSDLYGCHFSNDSVIPDYSAPGWMSATSVNTLKSGHDGWFEYVIKSIGSYEMVGFADSITLVPGLYTDVDFGFYNNGSYLYYVQYGYLYFVGYCQAGDVLHIDRNDTLLNFYQNNTYLGNVVVPATMRSSDWKIHTILDNASMTNIGCSFTDSTGSNFPNYVQDIPFITHCTPGSSNGSIRLTPRYGGTHSYSWTPGSYTTSLITGQAYGSHVARIKDANNNESDYTYNIGYKIHWKDLQGCVFSGDSLYPTGGAPGWGAALSTNTLKPGVDGWAEYVIKTNTCYEIFGFVDSIAAVSGSYYDIDYGLYHAANTLYYIQGGGLGYASACRDGDIISVERKDTIVNYLINGNIVASNIVDPSLRSRNWKLKADLYMQDMDNLGCSFYDSTHILFPNYLRVFSTFVPESDLGTFDGGVNLRSLHSTGGSPYFYLWLPDSSSTSSFSGADFGTYTVTVGDIDSNQTIYNYDVGFGFRLADSTALNVYPDSVYSHGAWGTALSADSLRGEGWGEFVVDSVDNMYRMIGFVDSTYVPGDVTDMRYAIYQGQYYVYCIINGSYYLNAYCTKGDVLKIEKTDTLVNFRVNNCIIGSATIPSYVRARTVTPKIAAYSGSYMARTITSTPPMLAPPPSYLVLHKTLDGGYYQTSNNYLYFKFVEEYTKQTTNLSYKIYEDNRLLYTGSLPTMTEVIGDNRFQLNLITAGLTLNKFYILEVTNEKSEKWLARFKY
ncbi:MAG: hypothetical protein ACXVP0_11720, partial [Bacteroidia bacterium]